MLCLAELCGRIPEQLKSEDKTLYDRTLGMSAHSYLEFCHTMFYAVSVTDSSTTSLHTFHRDTSLSVYAYRIA